MRIVEKISDELYKRADMDLEEVKKSVVAILEDIRANGDEAVKRYEQRFDKVELDSFEVPKKELKQAAERVPDDIISSLKTASRNIESFARRQLADEVRYSENGTELGTLNRPIERVGSYVPGGRAFYPSTVLMTVVPAKVAGVKEIVVCTPPNQNGKINDVTLAACWLAGADRVFSIGGVQAVGAMAYGTRSVPKVDKIVGPGNIYVAAAKELSPVETDFFAGPSEILIIADDSANPKFVSADILAQAEHGPNAACVIVTTNRKLARQVNLEIEKRLNGNPKEDSIREALAGYSYILIVKSLKQAIGFSNRYAPEHLEIICRQDILQKVTNAGSVFVGNYSPVAAGDYCSGTNHVLPTGGLANVYSGLSVDTFLKKITWQKIGKKGLESIGRTIITLADAEGLSEHATSIWERLK